MSKKFVAVVTSAAMFLTSCVSMNGTRKVASEPEVEAIAAQGADVNLDWSKFKPSKLEHKDIVKLSAAPDLKLIDGQLLVNNDAAFDKKLEMIQRATQEIRMVYFIYANDDSSSLINKALIEKAQDGVKVKLLVDFITNYKSLDLFQMLENAGKGNIKVYFYNFPSGQIIQDANYMVLPCPENSKPDSDTCYNSKMVTMNAMGDKKVPTDMAKIFLSGIYGKNPVAIKVALGYGAQIDPADYKADPAKTADELKKDKDDLIKFTELVSDAFINDSIIAKIKLSIAMTSYGDKLNPLVNEATGRLPLRSIEKNQGHGALWDHLSDYTHHKLLAVDGEEFILGGRNIEDSYHMNQRVGSVGKYIFMDTDFWGKTLKDGTTRVEDSFDMILKTSMVANLAKVQSLMPNDFIANAIRSEAAQPSASEMAVGGCVLRAKQGPDLGSCILGALPKMPSFKSTDSRIAAQTESMNFSINRYQRDYASLGKKSKENLFGQMTANDLQTASVHYIENVNYKKDTMQRVIGSKLGSEAKNNKNIQAAWYGALENVCRVSKDEKRNMDVIIHTAYLLMPSGMVHRIAKMMNNDYGDCSRVKITFLTNSPETTDLGSINILARYQLGALFDHYTGLVQYEAEFNKGPRKYKRFFPTLEYYEYKAAGGVGQSLHTKVSLIGDDLIVGSANADVRSYYMDTNNAVFIRNAHDLNQQYKTYVDGLISSGRVENKMKSFIGKSMAELRAENSYMLDVSAKRWHQEARLTPERKTTILNTLDNAGKKITATTKRLITFRGEFDLNNFQSEVNNRYQINNELNKLANDFDGTFKVF